MRGFVSGIILAAAFSVAGFAAEGTPFSWSGGLSGGRTLEIKGVNGWIHAENAIGGAIEVTARRHGRKQDPNLVKIEVVQSGEGVTICAVYPDAKPGETNECKAGRGGRMNTKDNDVQVEFTVKVPAGVHLVAKNVNGEVKAEGLQADVRATSVNGDVTVSTTGLGSATTVNGSIHAKVGAYTWTDKLEFTTVNGSIDVTMPPGVSADFEASSVNGAVYSDFQMAVRGDLKPHQVNATIGGGGRGLKMTTVNGSIRLRQAGKA